MKLFLVLLAGLFMLPVSASAKEKKQERYVAQVVAPFVSIYRERQAGSELLLQAKKGDRFVVAQVGEYWARVYVPPNDELGWVELGMEEPKVEIVPESDKKYMIMTFINLGLFLVAVGVIIFLLRYYFESKRKRALENIGGFKGQP